MVDTFRFFIAYCARAPSPSRGSPVPVSPTRGGDVGFLRGRGGLEGFEGPRRVDEPVSLFLERVGVPKEGCLYRYNPLRGGSDRPLKIDEGLLSSL